MKKSLDLCNVMLEASSWLSGIRRDQSRIQSVLREEMKRSIRRILPYRGALLLSQYWKVRLFVYHCQDRVMLAQSGKDCEDNFLVARRRFGSSKKCRATSTVNSRRNDSELRFKIRITSYRSPKSQRGSIVIQAKDDDLVQDESSLSREL